MTPERIAELRELLRQASFDRQVYVARVVLKELLDEVERLQGVVQEDGEMLLSILNEDKAVWRPKFTKFWNNAFGALHAAQRAASSPDIPLDDAV